MPILGYGEDALTYHALSAGITDVFTQLKDDSDPADSIRFFRPSFGRRSSAPGGSPRSEFGEFDAIIGTPRAVYLVEAKWPSSRELNRMKLELHPKQLRRHAAFRAYLSEWRRKPSKDWAAFAPRMTPVLQARVQDLIPPASGTTLARNLEYVLRSLDKCGANVVDVLLFCRLSEATPTPSQCGSFCVVTHLCLPEVGGGFIRLSD
jgi:hypothetical protein